MNASIHNWFGDKKSALHLTIDNETGTILGGYFDNQETLNGYYHVAKQILMNYGIPYEFLTDNKTIFNYQSKKIKKDENDVLTQFSIFCKGAGALLTTTSVSQAKGQIERANGTFQNRLVNELKPYNITTNDKANEYLIIDLLLAILSPRTIDSGSAIKYCNEYYQAYDNNGKLICFKPKTKCMVIKSFTGELFMSVDDKVYKLIKFNKNKKTSENFDLDVVKEKKVRKYYIPPMSHPWKRESFQRQQEKVNSRFGK